MAVSREPPILSTPAIHTFEEQPHPSSSRDLSRPSDECLHIKYEIERTLSEIRRAKYSRVALQFPDHMLPDAPKVVETLSKGLNSGSQDTHRKSGSRQLADSVSRLDLDPQETLPQIRLYILADTSYGACCVDEIAAEHVDADVVVHYGRACLSPTARIPVIQVFTIQPLPRYNVLLGDFQAYYQDKNQNIVLMADVTYQSHLEQLHATLLDSMGYKNLFVSRVICDPSSPLPNRTIPDQIRSNFSELKAWHLFHVSDPPGSLLLTLASRVASVRIFPTSNSGQGNQEDPFIAPTSRALNRRYALLTSVTTVPIFGILINTLSVKNYLHIVEHVKSQILAAGKQSYTFVVGKINAAKVANFSEVGAWVVIGCWESSLIDSKDFWKPVLTPFELEMALKKDNERIWTGEWSSDFQKILDEPELGLYDSDLRRSSGPETQSDTIDTCEGGELDSEPESVPPEFDLRTGQYVSHSRPTKAQSDHPSIKVPLSDQSLIRRAKGDLAIVGGQASAGAEYLRSKRTWKGLGSNFEIAYEDSGATIEEGRIGIARGYKHGPGEVRT